MERWQRQFIRSLFPYAASRLQIELAFMIKDPHIPQFLYKYRNFTDRYLEALCRGVLYMSSPDHFNDPFDTTVYFDPSRFVIEDLTAPELNKRAEKMDSMAQAGATWKPEEINNPIRQSDWLEKTMADGLKNESLDIQEKFKKFSQNWFEQLHQDLRKRMQYWFRSSFSVLSLSADPASILMWSHYSDSHQGFCVEYDFGRLPPNDLRRRLCHPVLYRQKRTDATRYMANTGATDFNNLFGLYLCLLKNASWIYEKEWRIVYPTGPDYANREIEMPRPSAVIVGVAAKAENVKRMQDICRMNGIVLKRAVQSEAATQIIITEI